MRMCVSVYEYIVSLHVCLCVYSCVSVCIHVRGVCVCVCVCRGHLPVRVSWACSQGSGLGGPSAHLGALSSLWPPSQLAIIIPLAGWTPSPGLNHLPQLGALPQDWVNPASQCRVCPGAR